MAAHPQPEAPGVGLWPAIALVVGHTIGVGIFLTPAELIGALASPALTLGLWVVCSGLVLAGAFTFAELSARYPLAGGLYIYLREGWGERVAFLYGWQSLLIMDPGITAALATGSSDYLVLLWPAAAGGERWLAVAVIWILALISMGGLVLSARVLALLTVLKLAAFAGVVVVAFAAGRGSWAHFEPFAARGTTGIAFGEALALGFVSVFFSFGGFWEASRLAGEVRDAPHTMPRALIAGVSCVTAVYVATTMAFIYLVPVGQATSSAEFARRAGEALLGGTGIVVLAWIVVLSVVASLLALLIMAPRLYLAMSRDRAFPSVLASISHTTQSPVRGTAFLAVLASAYVFLGTFREIVSYFMCTTLAFVALAATALVVVRRRNPQDPPFASPGYPLSVFLFVLLVVGIVLLVGINRPVQAIAGFGVVLLGIPAYALSARYHARREEQASP